MSTKPRKWVPVVDDDLCVGCGGCVEACWPRALQMQDRVAELARPDACVSDACCIMPCPTNAIRMAWVEVKGDPGRGTWHTAIDEQPAQIPDGRRE